MKNKEKIIKLILKREKLRNISKIKRLIKSPFRTLPYYLLASLARIKPFIISFKTLWGDILTSDLPNGNTFLYYGYPEANLTNFLIKNLNSEDVFIDGGANIGFYSLLASSLIEKGEIHSFEPTPSTFDLLKKNTSKKSNIKINMLALFDKSTNIEFIDYGLGYNAFNSIHKRSKSIHEIQGKDIKIKVKTITIDEYCEKEKISPSFIKLDLEGSEFFALLGAKKTLSNIKPTLSIEVAGDNDWEKYIHKTDRFLKKFSYCPYTITKEGYLVKHTMEKAYKYDNLIYIHINNLQKYENF